MDHVTATAHDAHAGHDHEHSFDEEIEQVSLSNWPANVTLGKFCMWLFLATEVMFFTGLIGSYFVLRLSHEWPDPTLTLNVPLTALNTFLLICSSVTMVKALEWIGKGDQLKMKQFLLATTVIGALFLSVQVYEYRKLSYAEPYAVKGAGVMPTVFCDDPKHVEGNEEFAAMAKKDQPNEPHKHYHFTPATNIFGSTFYIMTGCHGAHVAGGVILMACVTLLGALGRFTKDNHQLVELAGLYWHFVDLVWILLFTVVYLF